MSSHALHASLLRPAVIHILRAAGFHATKPSVVDTLTDVCARYMLLIASNTAASTYDRTITELRQIKERAQDLNSASDPLLTPTITDVRNGLTSAAFFSAGQSAAEEAWEEVMRKPLSGFPDGAREKERTRRDQEDTQDVREFIAWATGPIAQEIRRVAGLLADEAPNAAIPASLIGTSLQPPANGLQHRDDYLDGLKKKHSKSGDNARYMGTALGSSPDDPQPIKIEGGPASLGEWQASLKRKRAAD